MLKRTYNIPTTESMDVHIEGPILLAASTQVEIESSVEVEEYVEAEPFEINFD